MKVKKIKKLLGAAHPHPPYLDPAKCTRAAALLGLSPLTESHSSFLCKFSLMSPPSCLLDLVHTRVFSDVTDLHIITM